jgi:hypothetical protein
VRRRFEPSSATNKDLISSAFYGATNQPLGPLPVKGLSEKIPVYEVTGAGAARTRLQAAGVDAFRQSRS